MPAESLADDVDLSGSGSGCFRLPGIYLLEVFTDISQPRFKPLALKYLAYKCPTRRQ
jgi:hypothetical protein